MNYYVVSSEEAVSMRCLIGGGEEGSKSSQNCGKQGE